MLDSGSLTSSEAAGGVVSISLDPRGSNQGYPEVDNHLINDPLGDPNLNQLCYKVSAHSILDSGSLTSSEAAGGVVSITLDPRCFDQGYPQVDNHLINYPF